MPFYDVLEGDGGGFATADAVQGTLGEINVLKLLNVLQDGFPGIKSLGAPSAFSELFQALFDGFGKSDNQHGTSLYKYSTAKIQSRYQ
jgi:hypothetical protein